MEAKAIELPLPEIHKPYPPQSDAPPVSGTSADTSQPVKGITIVPLGAVIKFERAISIAIIVFALMTLSMISYHSLMSRIEARDTRTNIQNIQGGIGRMRQDLQDAKSSLETFDAPEGLGTLPIDPGDVAIVTITPDVR